MTDFSSKIFENIAQPGRLAWLVFRSIARFWAAIFLPYFRVWGETEFKPGSIIVARNFGLQTWIYCLRFFRRPVRIVLVDDSDKLKWFKIAEDGGLEPVCLRGSVLRKIDAIQELSDNGEVTYVSSNLIKIKYDNGEEEEYKLTDFDYKKSLILQFALLEVFLWQKN